MISLLLLFILVSLGFLLWGRAAKGFFRDPIYNGLLTVDMVLVLYAYSQGSGPESLVTWLGVGIFGIAVLLPSVLGRFIQRAASMSNYGQVRRLLQIKYLVQPSVDVAEQIQFTETMLRTSRGEVEGLKREIEGELATAASLEQRFFLLESLIELTIFGGEYEEGIRLFQTRLTRIEGQPLRPGTVVALARAAAETANYAFLWECYAVLTGERYGDDDPVVRKARIHLQTMILAVYGKSAPLRKLFRPLEKGDLLFPAAPKRYWLGWAYLVEGKRARAQELLTFEERISARSPLVAKQAAALLRRGAPRPPRLRGGLRLLLRRLIMELERVGQEKRTLPNGLWLGKSVIVFTAVVFGIQISYGGYSHLADPITLFFLGANERARTLAQGEYWRLVTSMFLHGHLLHIGFNLYVLWIFTPLLEGHYGRLKYGIILFGSGVGGALASVLHEPFGTSVGISGVVYGVLGAAIVMLIVHKERFPERWRRRQLSVLFVLLLLNVGLSLWVDIIDAAAHGGGFAAGVVLALVLGYRVHNSTFQKVFSRFLGGLCVLGFAYGLFGVIWFNLYGRMTTHSLAGGEFRLPAYWRETTRPLAMKLGPPGHWPRRYPAFVESVCASSTITYVAGPPSKEVWAKLLKLGPSHVRRLGIGGWLSWLAVAEHEGVTVYHRYFFRESENPILLVARFRERCEGVVNTATQGLLKSLWRKAARVSQGGQ